MKGKISGLREEDKEDVAQQISLLEDSIRVNIEKKQDLSAREEHGIKNRLHSGGEMLIEHVDSHLSSSKKSKGPAVYALDRCVGKSLPLSVDLHSELVVFLALQGNGSARLSQLL